MTFRRPYSAPFLQEAILSGLHDEVLSNIINNINELIYISNQGQVWEIASLDYHTITLYPRAVYLRDHLAEGQVVLHFNGQTTDLNLQPTSEGDLWRFNIKHDTSGTLLVLRAILEPLQRGSRLNPRRLDPPPLLHPNCTALSGDGNTHLTYCRSGNALDYLRVGFESGSAYHEMVWTGQGFLTRTHSFTAAGLENRFDPQILIQAAFIMMGVRDRKTKAELSTVLSSILASGVASLKRATESRRAS